MAKNNDVPPVEEQKDIVIKKLSKPVLDDDTWYVISTKWMMSLRKYLRIIKTGNLWDAHPGPVDNAPILTEDQQELKKSLKEYLDYELVPDEFWKTVTKWYGTHALQKPIPRRAVLLGYNYTLVEVYLLELKVIKNFDGKSIRMMKVSQALYIKDLHDAIRDQFDVEKATESRLWVNYEGERLELVALSGRVKESVLGNSGTSAYVVLETKTILGKWAREKPKLRPDSRDASVSRFPSTSKQADADLQDDLYKPRIGVQHKLQKIQGVCGLQNLGNTCFLNSVIQCISNTPQITDYFLKGKHLKELNKSNPLGMKGEIAKCYGDLIQIMWSGRFASTNPLHFKVQIGRFNGQYCGSQQHDAQELLTFLLDGIHEDLNRIIDKPYIENIEYNGQEDHTLAQQTWQLYKTRNDSIIVDTFHGMLKSRVVCPRCDRISVTFDPTCSLSVPMPSGIERIFRLRFVPLDPIKKECIYRIVASAKSPIGDICTVLSNTLKVDPRSLLAAEVQESRFKKFYNPEDTLEEDQYKEIVSVYELPFPQSNDEAHMAVPVYFWELCNPEDKFYMHHVFSVPLIVPMPKASLDHDKLYSLLFHHMKRHFHAPRTIIEQRIVTRFHSEWSSFRPNLFVLDSACEKGNYPVKLEFDEDGTFDKNILNLSGMDDINGFIYRKILLVQLTSDQKRRYYSEQAADHWRELLASRTFPRDRKKLSIYDCLDLFTTCEKLGVDNTWYCSTCKMHQRATKKFDLWKLPEILIIHIKRFSFAGQGDKIDSLVEFPIRNLDINKYISNPEESVVSFDLVGVVNHYGSIGGGHYTAYCKNKTSNAWYHFDDNFASPVLQDENIVTSAAYVLFYSRRQGDLAQPMDQS